MTVPATRRLILCADDYGLAPGVSRAIEDLARRGRLNATSVMVTGVAIDRALPAIVPSGFQIGLHVTLTGGLASLTPWPGPRLPSLARLMAESFTRLLDRSKLAIEIEAQFKAFQDVFGRPPDFVDGHQHVHLLPGIREAVIAATSAQAPKAWLRQCSGPRGAGIGPKAYLIAQLSTGLARRAKAAGISVNPAFSGAYDFSRAADFAALFPRFLDGLPDGSLVMVHPGEPDASLAALDPLVEARAQELAYLSGDMFPRDLEAAGFLLA